MKKTWILGLALLLAAMANAQSTTPFVFNISGGSYNEPSSYYRFEWSVGELAVINTMNTADSSCRLLHGVLQPGSERPFYPQTLVFESGNYKLFPNPTSGQFELNFFITYPGKMELQLTDAMGRVLETRSFSYDGVRRIQLFDLSAYSNGIYFVVATLTPLSGRPLDNIVEIQRGALKVVKMR